MSMKDVYRQIAKAHGVTVKEVREEIQRSINEAWNDPQNDEITRAYQNRVSCRGATPTPDELIRYVAGKIEVDMHGNF